MATAPVAPVLPSVATAPATLRLPDSARDQWAQAALSLSYPDYHDLNAWTAFREASVALAERYMPAEIKAAQETDVTSLRDPQPDSARVNRDISGERRRLLPA